MSTIITVLGEIDPDELGFTQPHEHLLCNLYRVTGSVDDLLNDEELAIEELRMYREQGGQGIVDPTNIGIGRDPLALRRISRETGVHVVMGSGWYRDRYYPDDIGRRRTNDLAEEIMADIRYGVGDTGVRAGVIGEIGVNLDYLTPSEERTLRAAGRAQKATGAAIMLHAEYCDVALAQLDILAEEGVDLRRVIVGHADSFLNLSFLTAVGATGAFIEFDGIGRSHIYPDFMRVQMMLELLTLGYGDRLLLATDRCRRSDLVRYGGVGYAHAILSFIPALIGQGVDRDTIDLMTVANPKRALRLTGSAA